MHLAAYAALGISADYQRLPIPAPLFAETVRALPGSGFRGINVTIPHKEAALALADTASAAARAIGAANTLTFASGAIHAENTDAPGMISAVPFGLAGRRVLVLGAGGTARAVVWAVQDAGAAEVVVVNRTYSRAGELAAAMNVRPAESVPDEPFDLIVHTTSIGMQPEDRFDGFANLGFTIDHITDSSAVIDFVYRPGGTPLAEAAGLQGVPVVEGHELLARQGALSFAHWFEVDPPVEIMRAALA